MKILILSWRGPGHPNAGGAEIVTMAHARAWVKAGHEVTLFTSNFATAKAEQVVDGVKIIRRGGQAFGVKIAAWWYFVSSGQEFDLVVDEFHGIPFFSPLYVWGPKLGYIHEVSKEVWSMNPWPKPFNLIPAWVGRLLEPLIFRFIYPSVTFMTVSRSTKKDLQAWGVPESRIEVIYNGVELIKPLPRINKDKVPTIAYLGALSRDKGIDQALEVFGWLSKRQPKWRYWVIGHGDQDYVAKLQKMSHRLGLANKLKFWGYVSQQQKFELLSRASVLLNPSIREGWGLVVIEAGAVGTPTVGFDVPGLRDSIQDNQTGILIKPDVESAGHVIEQLILDQPRYQKMSQSVKAWVKQFDWHESTQQSLKLIEKVAKN